MAGFFQSLRRTAVSLFGRDTLDRHFTQKARLSRSQTSGRLRVEELEPRLVPAVNIVAVKTATFPNGTPIVTANPGDTIQYAVSIANNGTTDATGVQFLDSLDPNTAFVNDSVKVSPMAVSHSYNSVGNTPLTVSAATGLLNGVHDIDG